MKHRCSICGAGSSDRKYKSHLSMVWLSPSFAGSEAQNRYGSRKGGRRKESECYQTKINEVKIKIDFWYNQY